MIAIRSLPSERRDNKDEAYLADPERARKRPPLISDGRCREDQRRVN